MRIVEVPYYAAICEHDGCPWVQHHATSYAAKNDGERHEIEWHSAIPVLTEEQARTHPAYRLCAECNHRTNSHGRLGCTWAGCACTSKWGERSAEETVTP